jgi:hypothetical protein
MPAMMKVDRTSIGPRLSEAGNFCPGKGFAIVALMESNEVFENEENECYWTSMTALHRGRGTSLSWV